MNLQAIQKLLPVGIALNGLLGQLQKDWLMANIDQLAPFLHTKEGTEALTLLFQEFHTYATNIAAAYKPKV